VYFVRILHIYILLQFAYTVKDSYAGVDFAADEQRDGATSGSYRVLLPDGRTQVMKKQRSYF
jgi:hypothetical protein